MSINLHISKFCLVGKQNLPFKDCCCQLITLRLLSNFKGTIWQEIRDHFAHIQKLVNVEIPRQTNLSFLWKLQDDLLGFSMGVSGEQYSVILTFFILSRLPPDIRMEWARQVKERRVTWIGRKHSWKRRSDIEKDHSPLSNLKTIVNQISLKGIYGRSITV